ncbi:membrane protein insertase, YidC/Oxa1 family, C-terminal domain-containing protein [Ruminococcaceae bacterium YRB3002]|nr:membrane protein insertase, YidC/Oxa1 family, C-terminal domain-containing protein [Ruminococcaceae bacterium YRB3002]
MGDILYSLFIKPLELIFELVFSVCYELIPNPAINLVIMSIVINMLVLPLYRSADRIQRKTKDRENELRPVIEHIRKSFKGDEKVLMLQTYYKINNYSPVSSLKSILSLILQIPFFIAAYHFLSHLSLLEGQSMGPVADLSRPDALITIGNLTINLLPILMTTINIISSELYTKGQHFKDKITLYLTSVVFLVLLYDSPSGLVFYWTLNNVFSLIKNIMLNKPITQGRKKKSRSEKTIDNSSATDKTTYTASLLLLTSLIGFLTPSALVAASPEEFVHIQQLSDPTMCIWHDLLISVGFLCIWTNVYYFLSSKRIRHIFVSVTYILSVSAMISYFAFGSDMGIVAPDLYFVTVLSYDTKTKLITSGTVILCCIMFWLLRKLIPKIMNYILVGGAIAVIIMGIMNLSSIYSEFSAMKENACRTEQPQITLSTQGKNVIVIMLDRSLGAMVPFIFQEKPELVNSFDGFTFYPNTISFSSSTKCASSALFGGYEYTPKQMNSRTSESLKSKHNEALLLMPLLFSRSGYHASVMDLPYVDYQNTHTVSAFREYSNIDAYLWEDYVNPYQSDIYEQQDISRNRNIFLYSLLKVSPTCLREWIYDDSNYHMLNHNYVDTNNEKIHFPQVVLSSNVAAGINLEYWNSYLVLESLPFITSVTDVPQDNFFMMDNNTTHFPTLLQKPDYTLSENVDNSLYPDSNCQLLDNGRKMWLDYPVQISHYHVNCSALMTLAKWFDYLRDQHVWDNTRIIIVADHGKSLNQFEEFWLSDIEFDVEKVNPLLMVKDFNSNGFTISDEFMTNADVPTLAMQELIDDPVNPFTGNKVTNDLKLTDDQLVFFPVNYNLQERGGNTFGEGKWYSIHDSIFDRNNWSYLGVS